MCAVGADAPQACVTPACDRSDGALTELPVLLNGAAERALATSVHACAGTTLLGEQCTPVDG